jgi:hypothetical protein
MRRLLYILLLIPLAGIGQVINPTPDMVFKGQLAAGRGVATDPSAYFSVGPTRGSVRGVVFPRVSDTSAVVTPRVNGLFVWSVQKNNYLYWDSTGNRWKDFGGGGISGTANYIPKFLSGGTSIGNSVMYETGSRIGIGTLFPSSAMHISSPEIIGHTVTGTSGVAGSASQVFNSGNAFYYGVNSSTGNTLFTGSGAYNSFVGSGGNRGLDFGTNSIVRMSILSGGQVKINNLSGVGNRVVVADTAGQLSTQAIPAGTVTSVSAGTGMSFSTITTAGSVSADTLRLSTREWRQKLADSLAALISSAGGGTVLSVSAGTGMSFSTITSSGAVSADTNKLSTRDWRQKLADSLNLVDGRKVDTTRTITINGNTQTLSANRTWSVGTVTSVGLTAGTGVTLSGTNPITTSGSITAAVDTFRISTRAWRQKGIDSLAQIVGGLPILQVDTLFPEGQFLMMRDNPYGTQLNKVAYIGGYERTVTIDAVFYIPSSAWTNSDWNMVCSMPANYQPLKPLQFIGNQSFYNADMYRTVAGVPFAGGIEYSRPLSFKIINGVIYARGFVELYGMTSGGVSYVAVPVTVTYIVIGLP